MTNANSSCPRFGIGFDYDVGRVSISLHGELDALGIPAFEGVLRALADRRPRLVTIDLSELRFCNTAGLRVMAELAARLNPSGGRVEIRAPTILMRKLAVSDLRSVFVIAEPETTKPSVVAPHFSPVAHPARSSRPRAGTLHRLPSGT